MMQQLAPFSSTLEGYLIGNYNIHSMSRDIHRNHQRHKSDRHHNHKPPRRIVGLAGLHRILTSTFVQILVLMQSVFLVTSQAFPVGCEWRFVLNIIYECKLLNSGETCTNNYQPDQPINDIKCTLLQDR